MGISLLNTIAPSSAAAYLATHASAPISPDTPARSRPRMCGGSPRCTPNDAAFYVAASVMLLAGLGSAIVYPAGRRPTPVATQLVAGVAASRSQLTDERLITG